MISVRLFSGPAQVWDEFGARQAGWTHFHRYGWRDVIETVFGHPTLYAAAYDGAVLAGLLPLVEVKSRVFGHYLVSMPFVNYGGPVGMCEAVRSLAAWAVETAHGSGADLLELRSRIELPVSLPVSHRKITVTLDLPEGDAAPLWDGLKAKVRSQVRRPGKEGVTVAFGPEQLEPFYRVFARNMRDLGTPVQSRRLFETFRDAFGPDVWFGCAYLKGAAIAAGCGFRWGREFEMTWASSLREHNPIAPNMLLYWAFMERCVAEGMKVFNFGRCTPGGGTHRFKLQWGGRDEPLWWYQHAAAVRTSTPSPDDGALSLGPRVWRHLPVRLATALGPSIVRSIP